ncbi:MAG: hypothetical protein OEW09_04225, partial [Anaerolineae bacterium]|nr:hypothetical protein [Anaerolineae bacterium]
LKAIEDESKGRRWLEEAEKLLNAGQLVKARRALKEADRLFPQGSPSREDLVKTDTTLTNEENERKQAIDSELERAKKAFDDYGRIEDELQKVRKRLGTLKGSGEYREDDIEDRLGKIKEILEHGPKPKLAVVMPILTFFLGILTLLFGQGILTSCLPQILPVAIPSIARVEVYMNGGQLDLDQLPSLTSGEEFMLEVVVLDTKGKRHTSENLVCEWSVAPLGNKDVAINTTQCKTPYTPSQEYSSQAVFVKVKGREQQFKSSGYTSMEFNITQQ